LARRELKSKLNEVLAAGLPAELAANRGRSLKRGEISRSSDTYPASRFFVPAGTGTVESQVRKLLKKEEASALINKFNLKSTPKELSELIHPTESIAEERKRGYLKSTALSFQEQIAQDVNATGFELSDADLANLFCARFVNKARRLRLKLDEEPIHWETHQRRQFNGLEQGERAVLKALRTGKIYFKGGYLLIDASGCLNVGFRASSAPQNYIFAQRTADNQKPR
jgi:hypothetical protein